MRSTGVRETGITDQRVSVIQTCTQGYTVSIQVIQPECSRPSFHSRWFQRLFRCNRLQVLDSCHLLLLLLRYQKNRLHRPLLPRCHPVDAVGLYPRVVCLWQNRALGLLWSGNDSSKILFWIFRRILENSEDQICRFLILNLGVTLSNCISFVFALSLCREKFVSTYYAQRCWVSILILQYL